jgi:hypothetical protein
MERMPRLYAALCEGSVPVEHSVASTTAVIKPVRIIILARRLHLLEVIRVEPLLMKAFQEGSMAHAHVMCKATVAGGW